MNKEEQAREMIKHILIKIVENAKELGTYSNNNIMECCEKMTDEQWQRITSSEPSLRQVFIEILKNTKGVYLHLLALMNKKFSEEVKETA
jgi:hypothetical protein